MRDHSGEHRGATLVSSIVASETTRAVQLITAPVAGVAASATRACRVIPANARDSRSGSTNHGLHGGICPKAIRVATQFRTDVQPWKQGFRKR